MIVACNDVGKTFYTNTLTKPVAVTDKKLEWSMSIRTSKRGGMKTVDLDYRSSFNHKKLAKIA